MKQTLALATALISSLLAGCLVGDEADFDADTEGAADLRGGEPAADSLRWSGFTSNCMNTRTGVATSGGSLSVLFDKANQWTDCRFAASVQVPRGVKLTRVLQFVRGHSEGDAQIRYVGQVSGTTVAARTFDAGTGLDASARLGIGQVLCDNGGGTLQISFTLGKAAKGAYLDSVDWELQATDCP